MNRKIKTLDDVLPRTRIEKSDKKLVERAARREGLRLSEFVRIAAAEKARAVLA